MQDDFLRAAADAAAQLVQLGETEALGMFDDHDRGLRHVDADLDDGGGHEDRERARGERRHHAVLVLGGEPSMHQADAVAETGAKLGIARFRRGDIEHLRLRDERADPIDLRAAGDGARNSGDHFVEPFERNGAGRDRFPSRRLFVEPRYVHVAVAREEERARDRRRGHDQKLGAVACALGLEREPLMHAEAVLLVDDDEAEVLERDLLLEQRVRADQDIDVARLERRRGSRRARVRARGP